MIPAHWGEVTNSGAGMLREFGERRSPPPVVVHVVEKECVVDPDGATTWVMTDKPFPCAADAWAEKRRLDRLGYRCRVRAVDV